MNKKLIGFCTLALASVTMASTEPQKLIDSSFNKLSAIYMEPKTSVSCREQIIEPLKNLFFLQSLEKLNYEQEKKVNEAFNTLASLFDEEENTDLSKRKKLLLNNIVTDIEYSLSMPDCSKKQLLPILNNLKQLEQFV